MAKRGAVNLGKEALRQVVNLPRAFVNKMESDAKQKMSESPSDLIAQGVANGLSAVAGAGRGEPPAASPGAVLANPAARQAANASLSVTADTPPNVIASSGSDDSTSTGSSGVTSRPSGFRKKTVQDAWANAADGSTPGAKECPTCGKDVTVAPGQGRRDWDIDHQPPWSQRDLTGMTRSQVLDEYNKGTRLECPSCNRSRGAKPAEQ
nr:HNH/ENDO VII family nuclease [Ralstonia pseudosolanacearum]